MNCCFQGIRLASAKRPAPVVMPDRPSLNEDREAVASELDRLASLGKTHRYNGGSYPRDLCVCPSHLFVKGNGVRVVHYWPNSQYPLNSALANPPVEYGAMDGFLELLPPGAYMGGIDLQDYSLRWLGSPSCRRYLGVCRPVSGALGVYLFLPFGLGPSPGRSDFCVKVVPKAARARFPTLRAFDFLSDLKLAEASGERGALAASMAGFMSFLGDMGIRYHAEEGKRWRPTRPTPWLGFVVDRTRGEVRMQEKKVAKALGARQEFFSLRPGSWVSDRAIQSSVPYLNFPPWAVP